LLVTSGLGGGFPAGYPVGTVAEVKRDPAQSLADVDLRPAAALDRSRELMFVWLKPSPVLPVSTATSAAATAAAATAAAARPSAAPAKPVPQAPAKPAAPAIPQPQGANNP